MDHNKRNHSETEELSSGVKLEGNKKSRTATPEPDTREYYPSIVRTILDLHDMDDRRHYISLLNSDHSKAHEIHRKHESMCTDLQAQIEEHQAEIARVRAQLAYEQAKLKGAVDEEKRIVKQLTDWSSWILRQWPGTLDTQEE